MYISAIIDAVCVCVCVCLSANVKPQRGAKYATRTTRTRAYIL